MWSTSFFPRKLVTERGLPSSRDGRTKCGKGSPTLGWYSSAPASVAPSKSMVGTKERCLIMTRPFYFLSTIHASPFGLEYDHELSKTQRLSAKVDTFPEWEDFDLYRIVNHL